MTHKDDRESMVSIYKRVVAKLKAERPERFARETKEWTEMLARSGIVFKDTK